MTAFLAGAPLTTTVSDDTAGEGPPLAVSWTVKMPFCVQVCVTWAPIAVAPSPKLQE